MKIEYTPEEEVVIKKPAKFKAIADYVSFTVEHGVVSLYKKSGFLKEDWSHVCTIGLDDLQKFMRAYEEKVNEEK